MFLLILSELSSRSVSDVLNVLLMQTAQDLQRKLWVIPVSMEYM